LINKQRNTAKPAMSCRDDVSDDELRWFVKLNSSWDQSWAVCSQSVVSAKD